MIFVARQLQDTNPIYTYGHDKQSKMARYFPNSFFAFFMKTINTRIIKDTEHCFEVTLHLYIHKRKKDVFFLFSHMKHHGKS